MDYTVEIDRGTQGFIVYITDSDRRDENYDDYKAETLVEAYFWIAKRFHEIGLDELQKRINSVDPVA